MGTTKEIKIKRRQEAEERQKRYDAKTVDQKLANPKIGTRERTRLMRKAMSK